MNARNVKRGRGAGLGPGRRSKPKRSHSHSSSSGCGLHLLLWCALACLSVLVAGLAAALGGVGAS